MGPFSAGAKDTVGCQEEDGISWQEGRMRINTQFIAARIEEGLDVEWLRSLSISPRKNEKCSPNGVLQKLHRSQVIQRVGARDHRQCTKWGPGETYQKMVERLL